MQLALLQITLLTKQLSTTDRKAWLSRRTGVHAGGLKLSPRTDRKEDENDPSTDCPPQMGRKLAGGTMPNDRSLRLFLRFPSTLDRDVLFIIMKDTSTILFNPKITRSTSRRVWSESEPKQQQRRGVHVWPLSKDTHIRRGREWMNQRTNEREKERTQPFFRGERGVFALWREGTGSRFPVGASRTRNCQAATQIGPAPNNRAYYRPFVSGSRVTFSPPLFFLQGVASATRVQGVVFRFKKAAIHCSGSPHLSRPCSRN